MPGPALWGVAALVVLAGCGSPESAPRGAASGSSSSSASASESASGSASASGNGSASASPSAGASSVAKERAAAATRKALLPDAAFKKVGLEVDEKVKQAKWDWFDTCRPFLPSESRQVTGHHGQWKGEGDIVSQTVVAYPDGVAEDLVGEVRKTVTCTEYSAGDATFTKIKPLTLPAIPDADAVHAWCMRQDDKFYVCHSVLANQDLLSSIWVSSHDLTDAQKALGVLTALAAARIEKQIRV